MVAAQTLVETKAGPVQGFIDTSPIALHTNSAPGQRRAVRKWLGIPYAQAERWRRPQPPTPWTSPLDCTDFKAEFPSRGSPFDVLYAKRDRWIHRSHVPSDEHAHHVNIVAPEHVAKPLPVMVWIHGGAYASGSSAIAVYDTTELCRLAEADGKPVIIVSIQYRLNILGWLGNTDLLEAEGEAGNYGLYDNVAALDWVQANIASFGGDPNEVTLFGESVGGITISTLFNVGRPLFKRAIMMSGVSPGLPIRTISPDNWPQYQGLLDRFGIKETTAKGRIAALRKIPAKEICLASYEGYYGGVWGPVIEESREGNLFTETMWNKVKEGRYDPWIESAIVGQVKDEGSFFNTAFKLWENSYDSFASKWGITDAQAELEQHYPRTDATANLSNLAEMPSSLLIGDILFHGAMFHHADALSCIPNATSGRKMPVWMYRVDTLPSHLLEAHENYGIIHTGEIPFVMGSDFLWNRDAECDDAKTSRAMARRWISYAVTGVPSEDWPRYEGDDGSFLIFERAGTTSTARTSSWRKQEADVIRKLTQKRMDELDGR